MSCYSDSFGSHIYSFARTAAFHYNNGHAINQGRRIQRIQRHMNKMNKDYLAPALENCVM
jgi:hypothetical protein